MKAGEIVPKADLEHQEFVAGLEGARDDATASAAEWQKKAEAEKLRADGLQAEKERLVKEGEVETKSIALWEAAKGKELKDLPEVRNRFLAAQKQILLAESVESVRAGYEDLRKLDKESPVVPATKGGEGDTEHRASRFDAFNPGQQTPPEVIQASKQYIQERFSEAELRKLVHGNGRSFPAAKQYTKEG
jgi:hypothetical protein